MKINYKITLGKEGPTDCCLKLNDKEFLIESIGWQMLSIYWDARHQYMAEEAENDYAQEVLKIIYNNNKIFN